MAAKINVRKNVVGVDFGSDSVRAVIVDAWDGTIISEASCSYLRWGKGLYQHPEYTVFRQHPLDYIEALENCVCTAVENAGTDAAARIAGLSVDTTGSTPCPVDSSGTPLALLEQYKDHEDAMFWLWKDHSAAMEAEQINRVLSSCGSMNYTQYQGQYSAEWFWAKILHAIHNTPALRQDAFTWVEHCDWMTGILCGKPAPEVMRRSACAAGHKALWHSKWEGLPDRECLCEIDAYFGQVYDSYQAPLPADCPAGVITEEWAARLHLPKETIIGGTSFDAHAGAVGAGIFEQTMVVNIGTSAVALLVEKAKVMDDKELTHICGQAENSIIPGLVGVETGQASFGDVYTWFARLLSWNSPGLSNDYVLKRLEEEAACLPDDAEFPVALDWFNGRRYPNTDDTKRAVIRGLSLSTTAPVLYRSLIFGTICGMKRIVDELETGGLRIEKIVAIGGISQKSEYIMQMFADVLQRTVLISAAAQTCALGAAVYSAVGTGIYKSIPEAQNNMCPGYTKVFRCNRNKAEFYQKKYREYLQLAMDS